MMQLVFGLVLLLLAGAVVLLFAMMGELGSRVPQPETRAKDQALRPLDGAHIGRVPESWPGGLSRLASADPGLLFVLSSACASCRDVATQLASRIDSGDAGDMAILISSGSRDRGEDFIQQHGLGRVPYFVDEDGDWVQNEFGVKMSPTGLVFREGRLESALLFQDVAALQAAARVETPVATAGR